MVGSNESKVLSVAASISDGAPIDWNDVNAQPIDEHDTAVLRELHLLDRIAAFHRSDDTAPVPVEASDSQKRAFDAARGSDPKTWGHLTIIAEIGKGTFGVVYRAHDSKLQSEVALKLFPPPNPNVPFDPSQAFNEARLLARIRHANVVKVYGVDRIDDRVGYWMEFVKGRTLAERLRTNGPFSAREAALVGLDLCRALAAVHGAGLLHGDVKAHNVMREEGGRTVLMDFGTSKDVERDSVRRADFAGTPVYLAPEVFAGQQRTKTTDIYSLGVLLFHLVTDSYPVEGKTRDAVERAHQRHEHQQLRDVRPDLPDEFVHIVEQALAANPGERHHSVGAFGVALAHFLGATPAVDPEWLTWLKFHGTPMVKAVSAAAAAVLVAGVGALFVSRGSTPVASQQTNSAEVAKASIQLPAALPGSYRIETALFQAKESQEIRLRSGARVAPGAKLFAEVRSSIPTYVYVVNEDEAGESFLLFPLPGQQVTNPLPAGAVSRLPGVKNNEDLYWQVDKAGGREHFIIFASPQPLGDFEQTTMSALPRAEAGKPIRSAPLSLEAVGTLRSVGGLAAGAARTHTPPSSDPRRQGPLTRLFTTPLPDKEETVSGLWVRRFTLDNPR